MEFDPAQDVAARYAEVREPDTPVVRRPERPAIEKVPIGRQARGFILGVAGEFWRWFAASIVGGVVVSQHAPTQDAVMAGAGAYALIIAWSHRKQTI